MTSPDGALHTRRAPPPQGLRWPSLLAALTVMLVGSLYPPLLTRATGQADHTLALLLFWAMSAGFVHGVGFTPRRRGWRWLLGGPACAAGLLWALIWFGVSR